MKIHPLSRTHNSVMRKRAGMVAKEVVLAAAVVLSFTMGLYFLGEKGFSRLYHFVATMIGSSYM